MRRKINFIGQIFGKLTVKERATPVGQNPVKYLTVCECGNSKLVCSSNLLNGSTQSCGCINKGHSTHGLSHTRIYAIWQGMHYRCSRKDFADYGGRGIAVCDEWKSFEQFYEDMQAGYTDTMTLERLNVGENYSKQNCTWATRAQQNVNKRNTLRVDYNGESVGLREKCAELNIPYHTAWQRIFRLGWTPEQALGPLY